MEDYTETYKFGRDRIKVFIYTVNYRDMYYMMSVHIKTPTLSTKYDITQLSRRDIYTMYRAISARTIGLVLKTDVDYTNDAGCTTYCYITQDTEYIYFSTCHGDEVITIKYPVGPMSIILLRICRQCIQNMPSANPK
jgi:hypothetical protein